MSDLGARNRRVGVGAAGIIVGMTCLTAASVPLYELFCRVTGYGGTTNTAAAAMETSSDIEFQVYFNADVDPSLPWEFRPSQREMVVRGGESALAFYRATNAGDRPIVGRAVYNVTPHKVGYYFNKVHCFCFEEQRLEPGESIDMPVSFFVDPALLDDTDTDMVRQITLSYTFFVDEDATAALATNDDETS